MGEGTTIRLLLPIAAGPSEVPQFSPEPDLAAPIVGGRALVVDDEPIVLASSAEMVADLGFEVVQATSAQEAIHLLADQTFDLLMTDHLMPGMTGTELARAAKLSHPNLPVLIVSGYADLSDIAPELERLSKPFRPAELAAALAQARRCVEAG